MFSAVYDIERSQYGQYGRYLHERHFWLTILLASVLHLGAIGIYMLIPADDVEEVPVRVLNVKLGGIKLPEPFLNGGTTQATTLTAQATPQVNSALSHKMKETKVSPKNSNLTALKKVRFSRKEPTVAKKQEPALRSPVVDTPTSPVAAAMKATVRPIPTAPKSTSPQKPKKQKSNVPTRYYREQTAEVRKKPHPPVNQGDGSVLGNSSSQSAEVRTRYTQTLSLWIDKHKIYPQEARRLQQGGQVRLRIRINRQGRIIRYILEQSSGYAAIDRAIKQMVDAANPVPQVPVNYPDKRQYLEFIIPINFKP